MPQPKSIYVTWQYRTLTEPEIAQSGLHLVASNPAVLGLTALWESIGVGELTSLDLAWEGLMNTAAISTANYAQYVGLKVALLDESGHYEDDPKVYVRTTPKVGGTGGILPQASICFTTLAESQLGKGKRGRFYMPFTGPNSWNSGSPRIPSGLMPPIAAAGGSFVSDVSNSIGPIGSRAVAAIISATPAGGRQEPIVSVKVGDLVDTQRRRRNGIAETYWAAPVES